MRERRRIRKSTSYKVGYCRPPKETRFKKGISGNPNGRPKGHPTGSKNKPPILSEERLKHIILDEAYRNIEVREGGRSVSYPMAQAVVRSLGVNAVKGQARAQKLFTELLCTVERSRKHEYDEFLKAAIEYKHNWEYELEDRKRTGRTGPEPLPHPGDIEIHPREGRVEIKGPMTKEEKKRYDALRENKKLLNSLVRERRQELEDATDHEYRKFLEDDIRDYKKTIAKISKIIPD